MEKKYVWQRLYKMIGSINIRALLSDTPEHALLHIPDDEMCGYGLTWLCPKPNKVLVHWGDEDIT